MVRYGQFCPVAKTSELFCERWMPLILRELMCGSHRFSEIQRGVPLISPSLLSKRLGQLHAGVIHKTPTGHGCDYTLTDAGWELYPIVEAMGVWGQRWARSRYSAEELDPALLMWDARRMLKPDGLRNGQRTVVEFRFRRAPPRKTTYWLVVDDSVDLCLIDPGHPIDLHVNADLRALAEVWMGDRSLPDAMRAGAIELDGPRELLRSFPAWFGQHPVLASIAPAARPA